MHRRIALLLLLLLAGTSTTTVSAQTVQSVSAVPAAPAAVRVTEGTVIRVRLLEKLDTGSNLQAGATVNFEVADPVVLNGVTVVRAGARATGTITDATKAKWGGRKGKLDFTVDYVEAVDGQNIRVRSTESQVKGKGNVGLMAAGTILVAPVAVLIRGKNAVVEKGTEFTVFTDQDRDVQAQ